MNNINSQNNNTMNKNNKVFAYARVSTKEQNLDRQLESLRQYVENERDIFCDKMSGKDFNRPNYNLLKQFIREGDELYIHSLDRLGRNKELIKEELGEFKKRGVILHILDIPTTMVNYTQFGSMQRMIFDMINNILIEVLSTFAEQERKTIKKRQAEGIAAAKANGKHFGRPKKAYPETWAEDYRALKNKQININDLAKKYNETRTVIYRRIKEYENNNLIIPE